MGTWMPRVWRVRTSGSMHAVRLGSWWTAAVPNISYPSWGAVKDWTHILCLVKQVGAFTFEEGGGPPSKL